MGRLQRDIRDAIDRGRVLISLHADERLDERGFTSWQVVAGFAEGEVIAEQPNAKPNPSLRVRQFLSDGSRVVAIWSFLKDTRRAKLVTVYLDEYGR